MGREQLLAHLVHHEPAFNADLQAAWRLLWSGHPERAREAVEALDVGSGAEGSVARLLAEVAWSEGRPYDSAAHLRALPVSNADAFRTSSLARQLPWRLEPNLGFDVSSMSDAADRDHRRVATTIGLPFRWPLDLGFETAAVRFSEDGLPTVDGFEFGLTVARPLGRRFEASGWARHRALDVADSSWGGGGELRYRRNRHRGWIAWAARDIETVDALLSGTEEIYGGAGYSHRWDRWNLRTQASLRDVEDENTLIRGRATALYRIGAVPGLEVGGDFELADSRFRSPEYYSPQELWSLRGRADYRRGLRNGSSMTFGAGFGLAEDEPNGSRWIGNARIGGRWNLTERVRAMLSLSHSTNPDYHATRAEFSLGWRPSAWGRRWNRQAPDEPLSDRLASGER